MGQDNHGGQSCFFPLFDDDDESRIEIDKAKNLGSSERKKKSFGLYVVKKFPSCRQLDLIFTKT